jgi:two-component system OmpR family response regulator
MPTVSSTTGSKWLRILIADDDRDTASMLALVLRDEGHEVQFTLRGDDALDICRLFRPDAVIADVSTRGASGYALARELRERHGNVVPMLIAIRGAWSQTTDPLPGQTLGFDHYLLKPCDPKEVIRLIEPLLRGETRASG